MITRPRTFLEVWSGRTAPERFDAYTRWSLYLLSGFAPFLALAVVGSDPSFVPSLVLPWLALVLAQTVVCILTLRAGIVHFLGGPNVRAVLLVPLCVLSVAVATLGMWTFPVTSADGIPDSSRYYAVLMGLGFGTLAVTPLLTFRRLVLVALLVAAVTGCSAWVGTGVTSTTVGFAVGMGVSGAVMLVAVLGSYRASVWMLGVVWEQERTRVLHARLAVAEERLRFSRDLHDVFGRTLSVVAVKSELAAELAARGRPGAEEQMLEVRRIAQDALREVRAVVAGYRSADLGAELAGARSVLRSAGIETTVHGDETPVGQEAQEALAWAVREAVTNVVRHSTASTCTITVHRDGATSVVEVVNDGVPTTPRSGAGSGLLGLAERLEGAGGRLETWADAGRFGLVASVPDDGAARGAPGRAPARELPAPTTERTTRA
ncbi:sensor histidine kinase [Cellulosimicrobium protaetiae]|uniref:Sensor histidine kinase n=1 Tax=Cellulosimicrobium protaetiae TaxID=2587808 RepID=A0A6M5UGW6_9MICO|nr:histidine kinase [Cellulosimicrobium protaetiae]QJW36328.1 sensor histidine kinase [Cellulosimicrobium protaetiae]